MCVLARRFAADASTCSAYENERDLNVIYTSKIGALGERVVANGRWSVKTPGPRPTRDRCRISDRLAEQVGQSQDFFTAFFLLFVLLINLRRFFGAIDQTTKALFTCAMPSLVSTPDQAFVSV